MPELIFFLDLKRKKKKKEWSQRKKENEKKVLVVQHDSEVYSSGTNF